MTLSSLPAIEIKSEIDTNELEPPPPQPAVCAVVDLLCPQLELAWWAGRQAGRQELLQRKCVSLLFCCLGGGGSTENGENSMAQEAKRSKVNLFFGKLRDLSCAWGQQHWLDYVQAEKMQGHTTFSPHPPLLQKHSRFMTRAKESEHQFQAKMNILLSLLWSFLFL